MQSQVVRGFWDGPDTILRRLRLGDKKLEVECPDLLEGEGAAIQLLGCSEAGLLGRGAAQQEELV